LREGSSRVRLDPSVRCWNEEEQVSPRRSEHDDVSPRIANIIRGRHMQAARQREERAVREFEAEALRAEEQALRDEIAAERAAFVAAILLAHAGEFSSKDREALRLTDVEGLSQGEARVLTDCTSANTYKQRLRRARDRLRKVVRRA
jgi:DNA-directed RNA polymerase specialized sigma24 family protein